MLAVNLQLGRSKSEAPKQTALRAYSASVPNRNFGKCSPGAWILRRVAAWIFRLFNPVRTASVIAAFKPGVADAVRGQGWSHSVSRSAALGRQTPVLT